MLLKKIFWFWWRKKKNNFDSEFLSYNLMLNSGKTYSNAHVQKKFLNETKNHNPPHLQVKWSVP